jgi:hypothetical protein
MFSYRNREPICIIEAISECCFINYSHSIPEMLELFTDDVSSNIDNVCVAHEYLFLIE